MRIKSYYARSVEDAMVSAALEMGPDAMLISSRKAPPEERSRGQYEVVFALDVPGAQSAREGEPPGVTLDRQPDPGRLAKEIEDMRKDLEGMRRTILRSGSAAQWGGSATGASESYNLLTASDIPPLLAREIVDAAAGRLARSPNPEPAAFERAVAEEVESRFAVAPELGRGESKPAIAALVGPPGAGKTTTLVKLAVHFGLAARKPVLLLSLDTYRVGASDQLRSYAAILGVGFQVLETVGAISQAIEENRGKELILIDTPGYSFADMEHTPALARFLAGRPEIDTHLVLSSSMKPADLSRVVDAFDIFQPARLLFTRLDETASYGGIFTEAARTGKPLSFFATGQRIPEDLESATRRRLLEQVLPERAVGRPNQARPAA